MDTSILSLPSRFLQFGVAPLLTLKDLVQLDRACANKKQQNLLLQILDGLELPFLEYDVGALKWFYERKIALTELQLNELIEGKDLSLVIRTNLSRVNHISFCGPTFTDEFINTVASHCNSVKKLSLVD